MNVKSEMENAFVSNKRTEDIFLIYYLALISIIEGVTFILLVERLFSLFGHEGPCHGKNLFSCDEFRLALPYSITSLFVIIFTTYQYSLMLICFKWKLRIWDTILPFLGGFIQAAQVYFLSDPFTWWVLFFMLCIIAISHLILNKKLFISSLMVDIPKKVVHDTSKGLIALVTIWISIAIFMCVKLYPHAMPNQGSGNASAEEASALPVFVVLATIFISFGKMSKIGKYISPLSKEPGHIEALTGDLDKFEMNESINRQTAMSEEIESEQLAMARKRTEEFKKRTSRSERDISKSHAD